MSLPKPHSLRFRQVHLDFHTSPHIKGIGARFDKKEFQDTLRAAAVDSITIFSKCHHGWSYHPTTVGKMHPHLGFDLLRAQYDACKEAGINCPVYLSAGVDNLASYEHPEWRIVDKDGKYAGWTSRLLDAGFHMMDFHSPYLDYLCDQIREAVHLFPDCDGIFLDIISQAQSCGRWSMDFMLANGLDPECEEDRKRCSELALEKYYKATTAAAKCLRDDMPVFHNSGHIPRGRRDLLPYFSHLELESLPTGGWGYDHFPMSAKYARNLDLDFLGMTGKFHTSWGEFGGFKHPNALRYECAAMLAYGSKCSVGDQLHPDGKIDASTYEIIGAAYREVEQKEAWCRDAEQVFDIGVLSSESELHHNAGHPDEGASRVFLEGHFLFGFIDREMDFGRYKAIVLPDVIRIDAVLKAKIDAYLAAGGKLILSGESGLWKDREEFAFDIGAEYSGLSPFHPDYILPAEDFRSDYVRTPQVVYEPSRRIRVTSGRSLGQIFDPYFNRSYRHFCSHRHTPNRPEPSGFDCGVMTANVLYFAHPVFRHYRAYGAVSSREFIVKAIRQFLGDAVSLRTNLPSIGRVSLTVEPAAKRHVLHVLFAPTINRGAPEAHGGVGSVEVVEDLPPIRDIVVEVDLPEPVTAATLVPAGTPVSFEPSGGRVTVRLPEFSCHAMVELTHG